MVSVTNRTAPSSRPLRRLALAVTSGAAVFAAVAVALPSSAANADPSAASWSRLRQCESSNNYAINTGNGYYGAYQFNLATWRSVGGTGYPNLAGKAEQDARALILYRERGWQPWTCATILGLSEDSDARSGRTSDISVSTGQAGSAGPTTGSTVPAWPGAWSFRLGDNDAVIKRFQNQMHARGYFPAGTGQYGPKTLAMIVRLQKLNGVNPSGLLGPKTWKLAWTGKYSVPAAAKPVTKKPVTKKPVTKKPVTKKPVTKKPVTKKPVTKKPVTKVIHTPAKSAKAPAWTAPQYYSIGDHSSFIERFQNQMHARGLFPAGTGQYGPLTKAMIVRLQKLNGLVPNGLLGPNTWKLAWTGKY